MTLVTEEVANAISNLGIKEGETHLLSPVENSALYHELCSYFVEGGDRKWWWESFKEDAKVIEVEDGMGFKLVPDIVPDSGEKIWFVVEEDQMDFYPIYETTASLASAIVSECYGFEYYLIPKDKSWLLCENHHNSLIGVGESIKGKLSGIAV